MENYQDARAALRSFTGQVCDPSDDLVYDSIPIFANTTLPTFLKGSLSRCQQPQFFPTANNESVLVNGHIIDDVDFLTEYLELYFFRIFTITSNYAAPMVNALLDYFIAVSKLAIIQTNKKTLAAVITWVICLYKLAKDENHIHALEKILIVSI